MRVHFLGVRGSTPASGIDFVRYGGHTSCVALALDADEVPTLILDAGTGIRRCTSLLGGEAFRGTILLSHLHWDHLHGLPFFSGADNDHAHVTVRVPDQQSGASALDVISRGMSPPHFPVYPDELRGAWTFSALSPGEEQIEGFRVKAREIPHKGGRTFGYRVSDGHSTLTYMPDHCPSELGPGPDGWGEYHGAAMTLSKDTDVLIHDAQLISEELAAEAYFGHAAAEYAVELGRRAGAGNVVLFHHKPDRVDDALDEIARRFAPEKEVVVASESMVLEL
ncbi:MAG TPA: MBL fold metallo-hydrolase [Acidimicrobiales bacterium]|nr:MBL fold metallo-hydrolase [Acidimicrobiales bacterium]